LQQLRHCCGLLLQVVGVLGLFFFPIPLLMKQSYLVWVGVVTAFIFTYIPEWTAWVLLVLMAVYDLIAVLVPGGPLKVRRLLVIQKYIIVSNQ
jgi:presenilin 1